jgi:3,4-dihydroxy 2-butanone 4-phosphate synthase/GTP cyclohydrolase II
MLSIERVAAARLPTQMGDFKIVGYRSLASADEIVVLVKGEIDADRPTLVRIHSQCLLSEVFGSTLCDCGSKLRKSMELIEAAGAGAIVYRQEKGEPNGALKKIAGYERPNEGVIKRRFTANSRAFRQCSKVLLNLGLHTLRVMSNNPEKVRALKEAGLTVVERVAIEVERVSHQNDKQRVVFAEFGRPPDTRCSYPFNNDAA